MTGPIVGARRAKMLGAGIAIVSGLHKMLYASVLVNDDFMHRAYALQLLAGERPVRDFFDYGMGLMYAVSALAQLVFGYRLLSEAIVIGVMVAISTFLVFDLVRRVSHSTLAAVLSAVLMLVAMPRSYGYPKLIVYAVAAVLWWRYVWRPSASGAVAMGLWTAVAFYWRPDHGVYVVVGAALAAIAAHGLRLQTLTACVRAGVVALALVAPWLIFASVQLGGFDRFIQSGVTAAVGEHIAGQAVPRWPLRRRSDLVRVEEPGRYAPVIGVRWTRDSSDGSRQQVMQEYGLTVVSTRDSVSQSVRLSARAIERMRSLIAEPIVEDTDGVDRGAAQLPPSTWPAGQRRRFEHWWLRLRVLPGLDSQVEAGDAAAILLFAIPLFALGLAASPWRRYLPPPVTPASLSAFAGFALLVDFGLLRTPFHARVGDAVVLPGILTGVLAATLLRATSGPVRGRWLSRAAAVVVTLLVMKSLAVAGQSGERISWVAGEWTSLDRARGAREEVIERLASSPPIEYWRHRRPEVTLRLASYARDCLAPDERILVLWFAPEIYYYSERLMAGRHAFFLPEFDRLAHEREMDLTKFKSSPPVIVFTRTKSERAAQRATPDVLKLVSHDYRVGGSVEDDDRYLILVRNERTAVRDYGPDRWPCYR